MNTSDGHPCIHYSIALHEDDIENCANASDLSSIIENCQLPHMQLTHFFLQLVASFIHRPESCSDSLFKYQLYSDESLNMMMTDVQSGLAELYPTAMMIKEGSLRTHFVTPMQTTIGYTLFANINAKTGRFSLANASFLTFPFTPLTWLVAAVSLLLAILTDWMINYVAKSIALTSAVQTHSFLVILPLAGIGAAYSGSLKASIIYPSINAPFRSIDELSRLIQRRQVQLLVTDVNSVQYVLLTGDLDAPNEELKELVNQINKTEGSLQVTSINQTCNLTQRSSKYVYFGNEMTVKAQCKQLCLRSFQLYDMPFFFGGYFAYRNTTIYSQIGMDSYALPNFRDHITKKISNEICDRNARKTFVIGVHHLLYGFTLIVSSWIFGLVLLIVEWLAIKNRQSWTLAAEYYLPFKNSRLNSL